LGSGHESDTGRHVPANMCRPRHPPHRHLKGGVRKVSGSVSSLESPVGVWVCFFMLARAPARRRPAGRSPYTGLDWPPKPIRTLGGARTRQDHSLASVTIIVQLATGEWNGPMAGTWFARARIDRAAQRASGRCGCGRPGRECEGRPCRRPPGIDAWAPRPPPQIRSSLSVCHFAIGWPRASLSGGHFALSCAILLSFAPNLRRMARRIAIANLCAKDVGQS